jgi:hypothetical protein
VIAIATPSPTTPPPMMIAWERESVIDQRKKTEKQPHASPDALAAEPTAQLINLYQAGGQLVYDESYLCALAGIRRNSIGSTSYCDLISAGRSARASTTSLAAGTDARAGRQQA